MQQRQKEKNLYFGSVRFFKHLIMGTIAFLIAAPTTLCILFVLDNMNLRATIVKLSVPVSEAFVSSEATMELPIIPPVTESPNWEKLYPELYATTVDRATVNVENTCYLTFDDGPSARTPEILAILKKYDVKATFFVVGKTDEQSKQWMRDIVAEGHVLGMHSYTHDYAAVYASVETFLEDYDKIYNFIYEVTSIYPQISRFPGGSINAYNETNYENMISELIRRGFVYFDWNVATGDAATRKPVTAGTLVYNALSRIDTLRRAVVLMHDAEDKETTVQALPAIIEGYQQAGFNFAVLTPEVVPVTYTYPMYE